MKSADLIGHNKFLSWRQLDGCSVTRPFLSPAKGVACETNLVSWSSAKSSNVSLMWIGVSSLIKNFEHNSIA